MPASGMCLKDFGFVVKELHAAQGSDRSLAFRMICRSQENKPSTVGNCGAIRLWPGLRLPKGSRQKTVPEMCQRNAETAILDGLGRR
jgi:hypothetical protein